MTKRLIEVDDEKLAAVRELLGTRTLKATVDEAFDEVLALAARRRARIDTELADMATDVDYQRDAALIMAECEGADAEADRLLQAEHGAYPYEDEELTELQQLADTRR